MSTPNGRHKKNWFERVRNVVWPRMGLRRYLTYLQKKVLRLTASPHAIGAGVASGAAVSVFPLVGLHFFLGFVLAFITRGNMLAAAIGTAWGNPITFPLFFSLSYQFGTTILGFLNPADPGVAMDAQSTESLSSGLFSVNFGQILPLFGTMMLGALPVAIFTWLFFYFIVRTLVASFQVARKARLERRRARQQRERASQPPPADGQANRT